MLSFKDFAVLATNKNLKGYEKVGFSESHRQNSEKNIFPDIHQKLNLDNLNKGDKILDIGCGCSKPVYDLIDFCKTKSLELTLIDSKEMLANLPNHNFVTKIDCEFPNCKDSFIEENRNNFDAIIIYSVFHHIFYHSNIFDFLDKSLKLLNIGGGRLLLADIPNFSKKKRFLSSEKGIKFHKEWSKTDEAPKVIWNQLDENQIDDSTVFSILSRYRGMGFETYLLPQQDGLPMNNTREDILIIRN
jgi:cyclopropane fatty-acyl-phospholipid synthase-like methyltransferase